MDAVEFSSGFGFPGNRVNQSQADAAESPLRSADFPGSDDLGLVREDDVLIELGSTHVDGDFTITGFFRNTDLDLPGGGGVIWAKGQFTTEDVHMFSIWTAFTATNEGRVRFAMSDGENFYTVNSANGSIAQNTWHFFEIIFDGSAGTLDLAIDRGTPVQTTSVIKPHNITAQTRIGSDISDGLNEFAGQISCLGLWDRVLTSGELDEVYNNGAGRVFESLDSADDAIFYYNLDEESGTREGNGTEGEGAPYGEVSTGTIPSSAEVPS